MSPPSGLAHSQTDNRNEIRLGRAFLLIASFSLVEFATAILSNSLTLFADAGHMLLDAAALGLAWLALKLSRLPPTGRLTFGYHRTQVLAAFVNSLLLGLLIVWILFEAFERVLTPQPILPLPMLAVAILGLLVNLVVFFWLESGRDNINMRAAALHVLGDILGSLSAIASATIVYFTGWHTVDALLALLIAVILTTATWRLLKVTVPVLLEAAPANVDADILRQALLDVDGVKDVRELRVWMLTPEQPIATVDLLCEQHADSPLVAGQVKELLVHRFGVEVSTVQVETSL